MTIQFFICKSGAPGAKKVQCIVKIQFILKIFKILRREVVLIDSIYLVLNKHTFTLYMYICNLKTVKLKV